jgi:hypothetical protein
MTHYFFVAQSTENTAAEGQKGFENACKALREHLVCPNQGRKPRINTALLQVD